MYDFHSKGCFPAPHSPAISMPEFLQELYAKINECVEAVNECITMVDTSINIVENWNTVKAECDMVMEQYANTMAGYDSTMDGYTQELEGLENRVGDLNTSISQLETLVEGYRAEVDQKADEVLGEISMLADSIVEVGTTDGWNWRKYKSGRCEMVCAHTFNVDTAQELSYGYVINGQIKLPFKIGTNPMVWVQVRRNKTFGVYNYCTGSYISVDLVCDTAFTANVEAFCKLEGMVVEET